MGIEQHLKTIKDGVFGRDVRQAIHDGLKQAYNDGTAKGNSNLEVSMARGSASTLAERLNQMADADTWAETKVAEVVAQISNLVVSAGDGTKPAELTDMRVVNGTTYSSAGEALRKVAEGEALKDGAIGVDKVNFIQKYKQLLDESKVQHGKYYNGNRSFTSPSPGWSVYEYVYLKKGVTYGLVNVRGVFSYYFDNSSKLVKKFAETDIKVTVDYTPPVDGWIIISRGTNDGPSYIIEGGLSGLQLFTDKTVGAQAYQFKAPVAQHGSVGRILTVKKDGSGDFTKVKDAIQAAGEGTEMARVTIKVHQGEYDLYQEFGGQEWLSTLEGTSGEREGLVLPDYVDLEGIGNVTLRMEIPDDQATAEAARRVSVLNCWKHNRVTNLRMIAKNTRYVIHDETNNGFKNNHLVYEDLYCEHRGNKAGLWSSTNAYAAGTGSGGRYEFRRCTFKSNVGAWSMHNNSYQNSNTIIIDACIFEAGSGAASVRFGTYGQHSQVNHVTITNSHFNSSISLMEEQAGSGAGNLFDVSGGGNTKTTYININSAGPKERFKFSDEVRTLKNGHSAEIAAGTPVKLVGNTIHPISSNESWMFYGITLEPIQPGYSGLVKYAGYIAKSDTAISTISAGQKVGVVNGQLAVTDGAEYVGYAVDANNILLK